MAAAADYKRPCPVCGQAFDKRYGFATDIDVSRVPVLSATSVMVCSRACHRTKMAGRRVTRGEGRFEVQDLHSEPPADGDEDLGEMPPS